MFEINETIASDMCDGDFKRNLPVLAMLAFLPNLSECYYYSFFSVTFCCDVVKQY